MPVLQADPADFELVSLHNHMYQQYIIPCMHESFLKQKSSQALTLDNLLKTLFARAIPDIVQVYLEDWLYKNKKNDVCVCLCVHRQISKYSYVIITLTDVSDFSCILIFSSFSTFTILILPSISTFFFGKDVMFGYCIGLDCQQQY